MSELQNKQPAELLKYGTEPFANYVDPDGDIKPVSDLAPEAMDDALIDYAEQHADTYQIPALRPKETVQKVGKAVRRRVSRGPFAVGEEGTLNNIEMHSGAQTAEDKAIARKHGDARELAIMIDLDGKRQTALEAGDVESAARFDIEMQKRRARREELGYGQVDTEK